MDDRMVPRTICVNDSTLIRKNIDYWDGRVKKYGLKGEATLLDNNMRKLEVETVVSWLNAEDSVLDIGCANGISTVTYAPHCRSVHGIDLSENMIKSAKRLLRKGDAITKKVKFEVGNILDIAGFKGRINVVVSVRCLINLPSWQLQKKAIINVWNILPKGGKLILLEGMRDGLKQINVLRRRYGLKPLIEPWYNNHFDKRTLKVFLERFFRIEKTRNLDIYFLISRVLYPYICAPKEPRFDDLCNKTARLLTKYVSLEIGTTLLTPMCLVKR